MSKKNPMNRLLSLLLAVAMVLSLTVPVMAEETDSIGFELVDNSEVSIKLSALEEAQIQKEEALYDDDEVVRVSIVLDGKSTIEAGFGAMGIADNAAAMNYRDTLKAEQAEVTANIQKVLGGELDVVWNLTLAANLISANVKYGQIAQIEAVPGVAAVVLETKYEPAVASVGGTPADPNMAVSGGQVGAFNAWAAGYTGAGSKVAIIDTGLDLLHEAFAADAFEYSLSLLDGEYDLLTVEDIDAVLDELNVMTWRPGTTAEELYANSKAPFAFSYIDEDLDVSHYNSEHGSHVAGISAANKYVERDGEFVEALNETYVQGIAPDAQILVMQVFGNAGGAYDSDYMAAIEDAVILGADSVNLSLGSGAPGMSMSATYQSVMESLIGSGVTVVMSAGNSGYWYDGNYTNRAENGVSNLYLDDVGMHTGGSPGTFTNSFGVASVDNHYGMMPSITVAGQKYAFYERTEYSNKALETLAGEQEFVFIDGVGKPEDFAAVGDAMEGKIAFCYRGETSFFEKANAAMAAGATALIICNNQPGVIYLNLTGYNYTAPVVSITQYDAEQIKAAATKQDGYYTGTLIVNEGSSPVHSDNPYYQMSAFSSWGVPGSLTMKPEIAAPGGEIYSVAGQNPAAPGVTGHDKYELMSGTSMAAPQVTGMVAVLTQYIRENGLDAQTGLDARVLAHSLLMSTAVPMFDEVSENYYPVLQQGAGQANIGAAVSAASYILMGSDATASYADGKVKAELGDDPDRDGVYTFSFSINNLTDEQQVYQLNADVFTQAPASDGSNLYMDTATMALPASATWKVNGEVLKAVERAELDFNGDEVVNEADAQLILDYVSGKANQLSDLEAADINGDGKVTSYDAYLFFALVADGNNVILPANGKVEVEVTIALTESVKAFLDNYYTGGAYIQAYVYAEAVADEEGVISASHSIPVLGFYGSWTDASMFDKGSFMEYVYGLETRAPYLYNSNFKNNKANSLYVVYASDPGYYYKFGGNPVVKDATYMPERNALSLANGDYIYGAGYSLIRTADYVVAYAKDVTTGEFVYAKALGTDVTSAYYNTNQGSWKSTWYDKSISFKGTGIANGTVLEFGIAAIPEYYTADGTDVLTALTELGEGAFFSMPMVIDNTAPAITNVVLSEDKTTLSVVASDNQYVAGVQLLDATGTTIEAQTGSDADAEAGETSVFTLDVSEVVGSEFILVALDYAGNAIAGRLTMQLGEVVDTVDSVSVSPSSVTMLAGTTATVSAVVMPVNASDRSVTWSSSNESVATVANGKITAVANGSATITATSVLDPTKSATCRVEVITIDVDLNAVVWDQNGAGPIQYTAFNTTKAADFTALSGDLDLDIVSAAVAPDGTIYAGSLGGGAGALYNIDPETYEVTKMADAFAGINLFYADLTYAPGMLGTNYLLGVYGPYVVLVNPETGECEGAIDEFDEDLIGIASCYGMYDPDANESMNAVYLITSSGKVIQEIYYYMGAYNQLIPYYYYMSGGERMSLDTGIDMGEAWYLNSAHYDASNGLLFWSAFELDNDESVALYAVDEFNDFAVYNLGDFGDDVWPVVGVHQSATAGYTGNAAKDMNEIRAEILAKGLPEKTEIQMISQAYRFDTAADGSLNAITVPATEDIIIPLPHSGEVEVVVVPVNDDADEIATTNGKFTVTYDATQLTLENIKISGANYYSIHDNGDGTITVAYVGPEEMAAGSAVAQLFFSKNATKDTEIAIAHQEYNDAEYSLVQSAKVIRNNITLEDAIALIKEYYDDAYAFAYDYAEAEGYINWLIEAIDEIIAELQALDLSEAGMTDEMTAEVAVEIAKIIETLEAAKALILEADELDQPTLDALLALLEEAADAIAHLEHLLTQAAVDVNQLVIIPALKAIHKELTEVIIPTAVENLKAAVKAGTEYLLEKAGEAFDALVDALVAHIREKSPVVADWIYNWLYNNPETVIAFFNEYGNDIFTFMDEHAEAVAAALGFLLANYGDEIVDFVLANGDEILVTIVEWFEVHGENTWALAKVYLDALGITEMVQGAVAEMLSEVIAIIEDLTGAVEDLEDALIERYLLATTGEYEITPKSYLVALGDGTAVGSSYVEKLADELADLCGYTYNYNNLAEDGLMIQDAYAVILDNAAEIAKADLVTLGFGSNGFNNFAADYLLAIMNGDAAELDWTVFVGEEGVPYVEEMKTKLAEELAAAGINGQYNDVDMAELVVAAVEAYAYSYVAYSCNLPEVVNTIHTINPEAQVIVVGMYNPLENVVLNVEGTEIAIGDYMGYIADAANVSALAYAMVTLDAIFVDAPAVETLNTKTEMTATNLITEIVINKCGNLNPSNAGHAYITEQILNALTITFTGLLGDADGNGVVNTLDAMMILQYYTELISAEIIDLSVCDLDGNGIVNTVDAMLILQYYVGLIEKFPVEN